MYRSRTHLTRILGSVLAFSLVAALVYWNQGRLTKAVSKIALSKSHKTATLSSQAMAQFTVVDGYGRVTITKEPVKLLQLVGATRAQVKKRYPTWHLQSFTGHGFSLHQTITQVTKGFYLGSLDGYVAIFIGQPGSPVGVAVLTGIPQKTLLAADQAKLATGIAVTSLKDAWRELEGLQ